MTDSEILALVRAVAARVDWAQKVRATGALSVPTRAVGLDEQGSRARPVRLEPLADRVSALRALDAEAQGCTRCRLSESRTRVVFGVGNPEADLVFVGEGPGRDEDREGEPFVGRAGQLLDRIIQAMGRSRAEVYICNIVKCRPPENRTPLPDEAAQCRPFLERQLEILGPRVIVALGKCAAQNLLGVDEPISRMRGRWLDYRGIPVMPTYHPAYLLRNPEAKRPVWEDMQKVMRMLEPKDPA